MKTPKGFRNWAAVLRKVGESTLGFGPRELDIVTVRGSAIRCPNTSSARTPAFEVFVHDSYQMDRLARNLRTEALVLDIGAHVGSFTVGLSERHPTVKIVAYEPSETAWHYLCHNVDANALAGRVELHNVAVSADGAPLFMVESTPASGSTSTTASVQDHSRKVASVSFDTLVDKFTQDVDLIKMDCEGAEYDIVLNSRAESWITVRRVVLEHHSVAGHQWGELAARFRDLGFVLIDYEPAAFSPEFGVAWFER